MEMRDRREVLEAVRRGDITPEAALDMLEEDDPADEKPAEASEAIAVAPAAPAPGAAAGVAVPPPIWATINAGGDIEVVAGEVADIEVDGPGHCQVSRLPDSIRAVCDLGDDGVVFVNAASELHLALNGADGRIRGVRGPLHAVCNVGDVHVDAELREGESSLHCNAGDVVVRLAASSDVRVVLKAAAVWSAAPGFRKAGRGQWVLGEGRATLTIDGHIGEVRLEVA